jgi:hypothetical protein
MQRNWTPYQKQAAMDIRNHTGHRQDYAGRNQIEAKYK